MNDPGSASGRLGARALARQVGIGQQCCHRSDGAVVVYRVHRGERTVKAHRGERTVKAHLDGDAPHAAGTRFQLALRELASGSRLLDRRHRRAAA